MKGVSEDIMAKKEFKAESKKLLDMMINSVYTNREIFLRELISNASDAIDKLYFKSLTDGITGLDRSDFYIRVDKNETERTITVTDNGIGMTKEELEENLGIIAKSGSFDFKGENNKTADIDIIGQFGVGFYSSFMVAKRVTVLSRAYGADEAYIWESDGSDGYTIEPAEMKTFGSVVTLYLKDDTEEEKYGEFLSEYKLTNLVKHYSDYIRYPIKMNVEKHKTIEATEEERAKEDYTPQYESYFEDETINSMVPIWKKAKDKITPEEYAEFYKEKYYDYTEPLKTIHANIEGALNYNALMFIPAITPYNYYTKEYVKGLSLYSSGVLITEKCAELLPDYFSFVRGLVDTQDLSLNISRETLQQDRHLKAIAERVEKKIRSELADMLANDREKYEEFYKNFGLQLKFGLYSNYGIHKDELKDLLMFTSSFEDRPTTFAEYVARMKPEQKYIYYACGESPERIKNSPKTEALTEKGYEIFYLTADVDEFAIKTLYELDGKQFKNVADDDLGIEQDEEEKKKNEAIAADNKALLDSLAKALEGKVTKVRISERLKRHAVCFASGEGLSIDMEKVLNNQPSAMAGEKVSAEKILELNPSHPVFAKLKELYAANAEDEKLSKYALLLYDQAMLIEGLTLSDPVEFSNLVCELMV